LSDGTRISLTECKFENSLVNARFMALSADCFLIVLFLLLFSVSIDRILFSWLQIPAAFLLFSEFFFSVFGHKFENQLFIVHLKVDDLSVLPDEWLILQAERYRFF